MEQDIITGVRFMGASSMIIVAIILATVNRGKIRSLVYNRSRWLLVSASLLLGIHTAIQFIGHFREEEASLAWIINLMFFVVVVPIYNLGELNLLRAGNNMKRAIIEDSIFICICFILLGIGMATNTLINPQAPYLSVTFLIASCLSIKTVLITCRVHFEMKRIEKRLVDIELQEQLEALHYTATSMKWIMHISLFSPWIGMSSGLFLNASFGLVTFTLLVWYSGCFFFYGINMTKVIEINDEIQESEINEEWHNTSMGMKHTGTNKAFAQSDDSSTQDLHEKIDQINTIINQWLDNKRFTDPNLNSEMAIQEMGITLKELNIYLKDIAKMDGFNSWKSFLRVEEAKRLILENPSYSYDAIAEKCGYINGSSMSRAFKSQTGMTPIQWLENNTNSNSQI